MATRRLLIVLVILVLAGSLLADARSMWGQEPPTVDIVLLVDRSASMKQTDPNEDRLAAMRLFVSLLERDRVAIVTFGNDSRIEVPLTSVAEQTQRDDLLELINDKLDNDKIPEQQATDMLEGLTASYNLLADSRQSSPAPGRQVIIILTDGAPCRLGGFLSSQDEQQYRQRMMEAVQAGHAAGVYLFAFGFLDPDFEPNPQNPCENPDPKLLTELNRKGLQGLEVAPQVLDPFLPTDPERVYLQGTDQIVDRYIRVWEALYGIDRSEQTLKPGGRVVIPPGTRTLFAIVEFEPPARPTLNLLSGQEAEDLLRHEIGKYLIARKDNPEAGERDVELTNASGEARLLLRLDYHLRLEETPSVVDTGSHSFAFRVEPKPEYLDAPDRSGDLDAARLLRLEVRRVDEDDPSKCDLKEGEEFVPSRDRPDSNRFKREQALSLQPGETNAEFVVVAGTAGLEDCVRGNVFTVRLAVTPTPTATPVLPGAREGEGGGLPWWVYVLIAVGLGLLGLFGWFLASRILSQRPGPLEGTLSGASLAGGRVDLGELRNQRATLGGPRSDIVVAGINGSAAVLFTERQGVADVTMLEPTGGYNVYVVARDRLSQFDLVGLAGLPAVSGPTDLGREALILLTEAADDSEIARIEWRASSSF